MRKLIAQRHVIRQNMLSIIGICLVCYFSYHALLGERSYIGLVSLEKQISALSTQNEALQTERIALENKVVKLRPGSVDRDLLEERAQYVLGYYQPDTEIIIN